MAASYAASVLIFIVLARFRLPLAPFLMIFAAALLGRSVRLPEHRARRSRSVAAAVAVLGFALLCNWTLIDRPGMRAANFYNLGIAYHVKGAEAEALSHYREALEIVPEYPEALWASGISLAALGRFDEASEQLRAASALRPDVGALQYSLAEALTGEGKILEAITHYREALRLEPDFAEGHFRLAVVLAAIGRGEVGRRHAEQAVALDPKWRMRLQDEAWRRATRRGVGTRDSQEGRLALELARWSAQQSDPPTPRSLDVLAAGYAASGRFGAAIRTAREGLQLSEQTLDASQTAALELRLALYRAKLPFVREAAPGP